MEEGCDGGGESLRLLGADAQHSSPDIDMRGQRAVLPHLDPRGDRFSREPHSGEVAQNALQRGFGPETMAEPRS